MVNFGPWTEVYACASCHESAPPRPFHSVCIGCAAFGWQSHDCDESCQEDLLSIWHTIFDVVSEKLSKQRDETVT